MSKTRAFPTLCIHGGPAPDPAHGGLLPPIHQTTTFRYADIGGEQAFSYSRVGNPTVAILEARLGELEGAPPAVTFGTGLGAVSTFCLAHLQSGDRVVASEVLYGGTFRLLEEILAPLGVIADFVDTADPAAVAGALETPAKLLLLESPGNPTLRLTDLREITALGRSRGVCTVVDNTFLTACGQRPLDLGADVTLTSTTKYVDGHNATVGGAVCSRDEALLERLRYVRKCLGTIQSPQNAWLTLQGLKTLPLRLERQSASALTLARALQGHPDLRSVIHPFLDDFPQHDLARRQQACGGGLVIITVEGGQERAAAVMNGLKLFTPAENLGSVESIATHPATMTHGAVPPDVRRALGIDDGMIRLSVGIEDPRDIVADVVDALAAAFAKEVRHG